MPRPEGSPRVEQGAVLSLDKLQSSLKSHNIPLETWGTGEAKTVTDLFSEIQSGETKLIEENGELIRLTRGLAIDVYCVVNGETLRLKEDRQEFKDGRMRRREGENMDTSMGEKLTEGESQSIALQRAIEEELGLKELNFIHAEDDPVQKERNSKSFPGLKSRHQLYRYDVLLPASSYSESGYVENQLEKSTYFVWEKVERLSNILQRVLNK